MSNTMNSDQTAIQATLEHMRKREQSTPSLDWGEMGIKKSMVLRRQFFVYFDALHPSQQFSVIPG